MNLQDKIKAKAPLNVSELTRATGRSRQVLIALGVRRLLIGGKVRLPDWYSHERNLRKQTL